MYANTFEVLSLVNETNLQNGLVIQGTKHNFESLFMRIEFTHKTS